MAPCALAATGDVLSYDDMAVVWGPSTVGVGWGNGTTETGVVVVASDRYLAALVTLGVSPTDSRLTHDNKAKLSNASTGGAFYSFAQLYEKYYTVGQPYNYPSWNASPVAILDTVGTLYGNGNVWWADYTNAQRASALEDLTAILNGNDLGGTSGGGSGGNNPILDGYIVFTGNCWFRNFGASNDRYYYDKFLYGGNLKYVSNVAAQNYASNYRLLPNSITVKVPLKYVNNIIGSYPVSDNDYFIRIWPSNGKIYTSIVVGSSSNVTKRTNTYVNQLDYIYSFTVTNGKVTGNEQLAFTQDKYTFDGTTLVFDDSLSQPTWSDISQTYPNSMTGEQWFAADGSAGTPPIPDTQWPEPDDPLPDPEPPEVPDVPDEDPITQPNPTNPTVPQQPTDVLGGTPPQYDPVTYPTEQTHTADLQGILDAMADHCRHLQAAIHTMGDDLGTYLGTIITQQVSRLHDMVYENLGWIGGLITSEGQSLRTSIYGNIGWLGDTMVDEFGALKDYLQQLFTWLAEQLNYQVNVSQDSYDDSSVLYWLKRIWSKMGDGISTRPVDPVVDPIGTGDWLGTLWDNLVTALRDLGVTLLDDVGDGLQGLVSKFPFSVPWDIAALLALLAADPVTPEFTIPCYALSGSQIVQVGSYVIDLDYLDAVMGGVRLMEKIGFVFLLMYRTKDFMELLEGVVGFD